MVKGQIQTNKQHKNASDAYLTAVKEAALLSALKDAFHQRGYMIRDLCSLFVANYYEQNSVRGTDRTDTVTYQQRRKRLALTREQKG